MATLYFRPTKHGYLLTKKFKKKKVKKNKNTYI